MVAEIDPPPSCLPSFPPLACQGQGGGAGWEDQPVPSHPAAPTSPSPCGEEATDDLMEVAAVNHCPDHMPTSLGEGRLWVLRGPTAQRPPAAPLFPPKSCGKVLGPPPPASLQQTRVTTLSESLIQLGPHLRFHLTPDPHPLPPSAGLRKPSGGWRWHRASCNREVRSRGGHCQPTHLGFKQC